MIKSLFSKKKKRFELAKRQEVKFRRVLNARGPEKGIKAFQNFSFFLENLKSASNTFNMFCSRQSFRSPRLRRKKVSDSYNLWE